MRTTRNMERQQLGLAAAHPAAGPSAASGARQSGRAARQHRSGSMEPGDGAEGEGGGSEGDAEGERDGGGGASGLLVCGFSPDGTHIVAGGNDCSVYIWQWALPAEQQQPPAGAPAVAAGLRSPPAVGASGRQRQEREQGAGAPHQAAPSRAADGGEPAEDAGSAQGGEQPPGGSPQGGDAAPWPQPRELCQLRGHRNDVVLLQFSHGGDRVATGSKDGTVRVSALFVGGGVAGVRVYENVEVCRVDVSLGVCEWMWPACPCSVIVSSRKPPCPDLQRFLSCWAPPALPAPVHAPAL
jgi:hypothetical protein